MNFIKYFFLALCLTCFAYSHAYIGEDMESCIRTYVEPSHIHILPDGIYYTNEEGDLESVTGVSSDQFGIYVLKYYQCPSCGTWNYGNMCTKRDCPLYLVE